MNWKKAGVVGGVVLGVFLGMKYVFPVLLPFFIGWILAEAIHPMAAYLARRKMSEKLRITESGIGSVIILILVLLGFGILIMGGEFLTEKVGDCVKYIPMIQQEAGKLIEHCCEGAERIVGIPAERSSDYIYEQLSSLQNYIWRDGSGVETAIHSVKFCVIGIGLLMISIVAAVLFLQEREKIRDFLENQIFFKKIKEFGAKLRTGVKEYLKAQMKIMLVTCVTCVIGLWLLKIPGFVGWGLSVGLLDALPVLGTGLFFIPAGILFLIQGKTLEGVGFFVLYLVTAAVRQFMEPRLVGSRIGVSPLLILLSVYLGVILYGGFGFLLGPLSALLLYGIFTTLDVFKR